MLNLRPYPTESRKADSSLAISAKQAQKETGTQNTPEEATSNLLGFFEVLFQIYRQNNDKKNESVEIKN